jgi:hypothetical protein
MSYGIYSIEDAYYLLRVYLLEISLSRVSLLEIYLLRVSLLEIYLSRVYLLYDKLRGNFN